MPEQTPPLPAPGAPHAYVAVRRTHSPDADRPEWHHRAKVIPAWDADDLAYALKCGDTLLPIGPDGDTGTRWVAEPHRIESIEELNTLSEGAVVLDAHQVVQEVDLVNEVGTYRACWWISPGSEFSRPSETVALPATVLHIPTQEGQADA